MQSKDTDSISSPSEHDFAGALRFGVLSYNCILLWAPALWVNGNPLEKPHSALSSAPSSSTMGGMNGIVRCVISTVALQTEDDSVQDFGGVGRGASD